MSEFELDVIEKLDLHETIAKLFNAHSALPDTNNSAVVVLSIDKDFCTVRILVKQGECYQLTINHNTKYIVRLNKIIDLFEIDNNLQLDLCRILRGLI